jgi:osmotically-inducible protein OsmY
MKQMVLVFVAFFSVAMLVDAGASPGLPPLRPVRSPADAARDSQQTMQARALLQADPALADVNIGVTVQDRVATLWGPVPSSEVAFRAEVALRGMLELAKVKNELIVNELQEPFKLPLKIEVPPQKLPDLLPPLPPKDSRTLPSAPGVLTVNKVPIQPSRDLDEEMRAAIRKHLQSNIAFAPIRFSVQDRRVTLAAEGPDNASVLQEAARAIARLPNVEGVLVLEKLALAPDK